MLTAPLQKPAPSQPAKANIATPSKQQLALEETAFQTLAASKQAITAVLHASPEMFKQLTSLALPASAANTPLLKLASKQVATASTIQGCYVLLD